MGAVAILKRLAPIMKRVYQTVDEAIAFEPDAVVISTVPSSPIDREAHQEEASDIPIIDYVSPSIWVGVRGVRARCAYIRPRARVASVRARAIKGWVGRRARMCHLSSSAWGGSAIFETPHSPTAQFKSETGL